MASQEEQLPSVVCMIERRGWLVGWLVGNQISKYTRHCPQIYAGSSCDVIQSEGTETAEECATIFGGDCEPAYNPPPNIASL